MMDQIYTVLGMPLTVCYEHTEVIKNFMILDIHAEMPIPPFDHVVHTFEARCELSGFHAYNCMDRGAGPAFSSVPKFYVKVENNIPFYIDSYEISSSYPNEVHGGGFYSSIMIPSELRIVNMSGHFDSRDFEGGYNSTKKRCKLKPPEPIDSRFDILDL
jgi:hypothetical protein